MASSNPDRSKLQKERKKKKKNGARGDGGREGREGGRMARGKIGEEKGGEEMRSIGGKRIGVKRSMGESDTRWQDRVMNRLHH